MAEVEINVVPEVPEVSPASLLESALVLLEEHPRERPPRLQAAREKLIGALEILNG